MTNSRLTDPEILEARFPVVLEDFHIRAGSGGRGRWSPATAPAAPSGSARRWTCAILVRRTARSRRTGSLGGEPGGARAATLVRRRNGQRRGASDGCDQTVHPKPASR
jgi:5-oxoprolinase (ATP-hydrolysing)